MTVSERRHSWRALGALCVWVAAACGSAFDAGSSSTEHSAGSGEDATEDTEQADLESTSADDDGASLETGGSESEHITGPPSCDEDDEGGHVIITTLLWQN